MVQRDEEQQPLATNGGSRSTTPPSLSPTSAAEAAASVYGAVASPRASKTTQARGSIGNGVHNNKGRHSEADETSPLDPFDMTANGKEEGIRRHIPRAASDSDLWCRGLVGFELTFRGRSPKFIRFGVLWLITLLPFGAHFVKSCFSSLEIYFLEDPNLHFNETKYGSLMSAISLPNLFMPFFGGLFLDSNGHKTGIILFLSLELIGHIVFTLAMGYDNFWMAIVGEAIHGIGSGSIVVAMRAVVSKYFLEKELTFALGVTIAGACVSKTLAKASVAPIAETKWGYMGALWYVALWQLLSLTAGLFYVRLAASARNRCGMDDLEELEQKDLRVRSLLVALKRSTLSFWLVSILHTLLVMAYHLFSNYSGHFLVELYSNIEDDSTNCYPSRPRCFQNYNDTPVLAGFISALMPLVVVLCAPIAGLILDRWGRQLYVLLVANIVTIVSYVLLLEERVGAVVCILMLAFCESFVPTILLSALPLTVDSSVYGAAFGMAEVLSALTTIVANVFFGYSRDQTSSYNQDIASLVVLSVVCLAIALFLLFWDMRYEESLLNRSKRTATAVGRKLLG